MLSANAHMKELYRCEAGGDVNALFHVDGNQQLSVIVKALGPGHTWTGRIYPQENRYGIASVDVMLQREAEDEAKVWLYTLEHPKVNDDVRYSSRSELKMLRVLLENTLEYIFFRDVQGHFILTNRAFRAAVSHGTKAPNVDNSIADFVSEESSIWFSRLDRQLAEDGRAVVNEVASVTLSSGLQHWLQLSIVPVRSGEGEIIGTLSVARDISELKRTEDDLRLAIDQARAASRAKGEFLAAMSHEIRTPINGIIGASELCEETRLDREQRSYIDTVLQCGNTLLTLVNDVLDFSKIEAGQLNLEKLNFVPRTLMENVTESFIQETRKKGIELITAYDEDLPAYLMGDPTRLKQVLNNLVSNAVKFTEKGEIVIRAETLDVSAKSAKVRFSVSDTGIGISDARKEAIFESFTQEDMSTTRKYGGTGLGLSISRQLVEMMDGKIRVASQVGKGSVFSFDVPFELGGGKRKLADRPEVLPEVNQSLEILIVEDNPVNQVVAKQRLKKLHYKVTLASNSFEALQAVGQKRFDCILMDIQMPGRDGYETTAEIRKLEKESGHAPQYIVAMTAHAMKGDEERCLVAGMDNYIAKPFRVDRLKEVLYLALVHKEKVDGPELYGECGFADYINTLDEEDREDLMFAAEIFVQTLPDDIKKLQFAIDEKDYDKCYFMAHNLKSVVGYFGEEKLANLAEVLEQASVKELAQDVRALGGEFIESLQSLFGEVEAELQKVES